MKTEFFEQFPTMRDLGAYLKSKPETANTTAVQYIKANLPKESAFQAKIIASVEDWKKKRLIDPNTLIWKNTAGVYNRNGLPDLLMVSGGKFFALEVKRPYLGKLSPLQKKAIVDINLAGGNADAVSYPSEVKATMIEADVWLGEVDAE